MTNRKRLGDSRLNFAPAKFFSFSRGAKFGEFRLSAPAQVVCGSLVGVTQWGEIV
jgi:hypothetical protein